ncbi:unnamed protein product, partial [Brenthis ino]
MLMTKSITDDTPKECKKYGICANVENYPTELAKKLIAELACSLNSGEDRQANKQSLCTTIKKSWSPRLAHHDSGDFKHILNDDIPIQVFSIGICQNSNEPRDDISMLCRSETMLLGYEGQCIEKTRLNEMYYIEGNRTARGYFHVPTCCSCDLKRI